MASKRELQIAKAACLEFCNIIGHDRSVVSKIDPDDFAEIIDDIPSDIGSTKGDRVMKPFNLERALAGDPVITRDEKKVSEIHYFSTARGSAPLIAIIEGVYFWFSEEGKYWESGSLSTHDLFMAPKTKTYWYAVYWSNPPKADRFPSITGLFVDKYNLISVVSEDNIIELRNVEIEE